MIITQTYTGQVMRQKHAILTYLLVTCLLRSFSGLTSQIHHIIISTNTRVRSVKVGNKFNFNIFPMIVQSNFKTIYICCIYYAFRKCIPMGYYSLGKPVFSFICTTMLLVYLVFMCSCSCSIIFGEYGVDFYFVHKIMILKVSTTSALILLYCSVGILRCFNLLP